MLMPTTRARPDRYDERRRVAGVLGRCVDGLATISSVASRILIPMQPTRLSASPSIGPAGSTSARKTAGACSPIACSPIRTAPPSGGSPALGVDHTARFAELTVALAKPPARRLVL